jgi:hypothetical protein
MYTRIGIVVFEMGASDLHNIASFRNYLSGVPGRRDRRRGEDWFCCMLSRDRNSFSVAVVCLAATT